MKAKWKWLPPWNMPKDPVQAVFWFLRWFLQVLVRYFPVLILAGAGYEAYLNGVVGLFGTLFVGLVVWAGLAVLRTVVNVSSSISRVYSELNQYQQQSSPFSPTGRSSTTKEENVVEGSIITDLDEERRRRRQEM